MRDHVTHKQMHKAQLLLRHTHAHTHTEREREREREREGMCSKDFPHETSLWKKSKYIYNNWAMRKPLLCVEWCWVLPRLCSVSVGNVGRGRRFLIPCF